MQWINKTQFHGQVKTGGLEKSMQWKTGSVTFDYDADSDVWKVKLFFKVNPNRVSKEILIKRSVTLSLKCGRLIIDDKHGNGIHIKLTNSDTATVKALISQIQKSEPSTQNHNKAEVGIIPKSSALGRKGCENVSPPDHSSLLLSNSDRFQNKTPKHGTSIVQNQPAKSNSSDKPSHRLNGPEGGNRNGLFSWDEDMEEETTPGKFTGMKDISKRTSPIHNGPGVTSGLGTKRFYGSLGSQTSDHSSRRLGNGSVQNSPIDQSPRLKRVKLNSDTEGYKSPSSLTLAGIQSRSKMPAVRLPESLRQSDSPQKDNKTSVMTHAQNAEVEHNQTSEADGSSESTVGFDNLGNTCFMNSPLQCLSSLEPLSIDFQTAVLEYGSELRPSSVTRLLYLLMKDVRKQNVCPDRVRQILIRLRHDINGKFAFNTQQDAHELLAELLDRTDEEMKSVMRARDPHSAAGDASSAGAASASSQGMFANNSTPIETNFMWFYKTSFFFHECKTEVTSQQEERDTTLMLALDSDKDSSLQDCIDRYFESSEVDMRCEKCGKEEKATMTRKIVRRPRIFILNLLRYQTDNAESKKKMDSVGISSYMSVAEYCAEDVKAPPCMEPVFMLDRKSTSSKNQISAPLPDLVQTVSKFLPSDEIEAEAKIKLDEQTKEQIEAEGKIKLDEQTKEQIGQPVTKKVSISEPEKTVVSDADVKLLAQSLVEKFWEVERCMHEFSGVNIDGLYAETRAIISETNAFVEQVKEDFLGVNATDIKHESSDQSGGYPQENRMAICDRLMNKALLDNDDSNPDKLEIFLDDSDCTLVCNEVLVIRYGSYTKEEQKINHFIEDLGLYLAAKNLGIVKPDTPSDKSNQGQSLPNTWDVGELPDIKIDSSLAEVGGGEHSDEEVTFKRDSDRVKRRQGVVLKPDSSPWVDHQDKKIDCGTEMATSSCSGAIFPQTEHQYFNPDAPSNLLQGKDIGLYTEQELQQVDVNSLTEDEMLVYAQALSRIEYLKETSTLMQEDDMDLCDAYDKAMTASIGSGASRSSLSSGDIWSGNLNDSKEKIVSSAGIDISPKSKPTSTSSKQQSTSPEYLTCDEDLGELDDIERKKGGRQSKGKSRWSGNRGSNPPDYHWSELEPSIPKYCDFCNKEFEDECISCSVINQPGLDSSLMAFTGSNRYPRDKTSDGKTKVTNTQKCNTPPDNGKILKPLNDKDTDMQPCGSKSPTDPIPASTSDILKQAESSGDHVVPTCSALPSPRKEKYLFSPSKSNNLTKSRDYSRLRSPSASPRKRNRPSRSSSASKRLLFPADERSDKNENVSYMDDGTPFHDTSMDLNTSLEVNIDDSSCDTRDESFMTPSCSNRSSHSQAGPPLSPLAKHSLNASTTSVILPKFSASGKQGTHLPDAANSSQSQVLQANQSQTDPHARESRTSSNISKNEQFSSKERLRENKSERVQTLGKSKSSWSSVSSNIEEKENDPADQARSKRLENIEVGKADFSYRLVGIVNHIGESLYAGHYTAFAYNLSKQKWFYMDDKHTKETSEAIAKRESLQSGYVFFYMDKDLFHEYAAKVEEASTRK